MVKTKKSKKDSIKPEEIESDAEIKQADQGSDDGEETSGKSIKVKKDKKKLVKNEVKDDDENGEAVIDKITKKVNNNASKNKSKKPLSDDEADEESEENLKKLQKNTKSGFALLNVSDDDVSHSDEKNTYTDEENEGSDHKIVNKKGKDSLKNQTSVDSNSKPKEIVSKKGKKAKKKRNDSDDDIEKALAELEIEYSGGRKTSDTVTEATVPEKKVKTAKKQAKVVQDEKIAPEEGEDDNEEENEGGTVKSAAQKKKEKKERQKREAALQKQQEAAKVLTQTENKIESEIEIEGATVKLSEKVDKKKEKPIVVKPSIESADPEILVDNENLDKPEDEKEKTKDDKKKKKKEKEKAKVLEDKEKDKGKKGPGKHLVAAMQERLKAIREEEEKQKREEEERIKLEEETERVRLEQLRLEQERKEKKKQKEKERKERLKAEGKLLSNKQKADKARAHAMLEALKAQGVDIPEVGEKRTRPGTRVRLNKKKDQNQDDAENKIDDSTDNSAENKNAGDNIVSETDLKTQKDDVKESWDASSSSEEEEETPPPVETKKSGKNSVSTKPVQKQKSVDKSESYDETSSEDEDGSDEDSDESDEDNDSDQKNDDENKIERVRERLQKRRTDADNKRTIENLRAAVVCVLGHVDTGKTKILDKLRRTNVQDGEAGGITQQIGATNVPVEAIKEQTKIVKGFAEGDIKLPGLLIIDTPGHESFSNLRSRGSSLCDIAILVVDIMHGLEPQTIESLNLLKTKKTPFIVALNKIDRLYDWQTMPRKDIRDVIKGQQTNTQLEFNERTKSIIIQFAEHGLNASLFYENPDPRTYVSLVPTSAITGEGMGNLLFLIVESCQKLLSKRLMYSEELLATVLEVKAISGLGTTIDAILINGKLREGDTMIIAGTDGPIVTQIRSLLMPQPMKELRVKNAYIEYKEIIGAQGVKIAAKELEKAIAGLNIHIAHKPDEVELLKEEVARDLRSALSGIKLSALGVYVQASTLGSLEALLEFLRTSKIPYTGIRIGPVVKRDVVKASTMLEHEPQYATILAFDVKIERDAQELADSLGVKIFQADIIYHLFDKFTNYRDDLKKRKRDEFKSIAVFPCKVKILPQFIFNSRDPIVIGVMIEAGILKVGTPICVPSKEFVELGVVTSIECNHKQIDTARKGQEVCIKIEPIPGESPKMYGRHFEDSDMLISKISRQSIDACKEYFRDDLIKSDWALMVELKKIFQIL